MPFILILTAAAGICLLIMLYCCRVAFLSPDKIQNDIYNVPTEEQYLDQRDVMFEMIRSTAALPFQPVEITSYDGLRLAGRYYHRAEGAPLVICFHGYRGTAIRDFCGGARLALDQGYNVLLVDQRAHGNSQGHFITFGIRERRDCRSWVDWARERFGADTPMLLYGISMGGATVLMAAPDLPENVRGIVADSPYSSPVDIIRKTCRDMGIPAAPATPFIHASARLFAVFSLSELTAAQAVQNTDIPIMIIHGEDDRFVPCSMSAEIAAANPRIRRYTFPGGGHGISYMKDKARYHRLVEGFSAEVLCPNSKN